MLKACIHCLLQSSISHLPFWNEISNPNELNFIQDFNGTGMKLDLESGKQPLILLILEPSDMAVSHRV